MSRRLRRLIGKQSDTAEMKNACYCTLLAAALLVSCQRTPTGAQTASSGAGSQTGAADHGSAQEIPANTVFWVRLRKDMDSAHLKAGDHFSAEVSSPVVLNGAAVVPQGTPVDGVVEQSQTAAQQGASGQLQLRLASFRLGLRTFPLQTAALTLQSPVVSPKAGGDARHEGDAFAPKNENLQFVLSAPVNMR